MVANRLSENSKWNVLLLEAGLNENNETDVPLLPLSTFEQYLWHFKTVPQKSACYFNSDQCCDYPRGKAVGGSSVINYMVYMRGDKEIFNQWAEAGNSGWSYKDVLYYFKKSENNTMPGLSDEYHGRKGLLTIGQPTYTSPLAKAFINAGLESGYAYNDLNGANGSGFMNVQATLRDGKRCSTSKAFLQSARNRPNLHISMNSFVTRININPTTNTTIGVEFVRDNLTFSIQAKKEVILSAGTINSPHILMLSGIGPSADLAKHNITIIKDLPVGKNLQDHTLYTGLTFTQNKTSALIDLDKLTVEDTYEYAHKNTGVFTSVKGYTNTALIASKYAVNGIPDIQLFFSCMNAKYNSEASNGKQSETTNQNNTFLVLPCLVQPRSVGSIKLNSSDPFDVPLIDPNFLDNAIDRKILIEGINILIKLMKTKSFAKFNVIRSVEITTMCSQLKIDSDQFFDCMLNQFSAGLYHPVGTCKMGPISDSTTVVDETLKVHGIKGLRVIDASIMPVIVNVNTNGPAIMIGEKGADLIKTDWNAK